MPSSSSSVSRAADRPRAPPPACLTGRAPASADRAAVPAADSRRRASRARRRAASAGRARAPPGPVPPARPSAAPRGGRSRPARTARTRGRRAAVRATAPSASRKKVERDARRPRPLPPGPTSRSNRWTSIRSRVDVEHVAGCARARRLGSRAPCAARRRGSGGSRPRSLGVSRPRAPRRAGRSIRPLRHEATAKPGGSAAFAVSARARAPPPVPRTARGRGTRSVARASFYHCQRPLPSAV